MSKETIYYGPNADENKKKLSKVQDVTSLALGVGAGILAPEPVYGFLFYVIGYTVSNIAFYITCCEGLQGRAGQFYKSPVKEIFVDNLLHNIPEYIMMWCLVYALVK
ncbi:ER membrane protein complex subunit 6 [[Candida] railenensis]|uniref:ER membrane protein complex subunit 6 n=1 Tax=[Candida] railenensis TaxID=45579 RepID=A0A9P0QUG8_9ASCO|nr:ER membrane protein complex subunit 6 [[Candida] railenensis]